MAGLGMLGKGQDPPGSSHLQALHPSDLFSPSLHVDLEERHYQILNGQYSDQLNLCLYPSLRITIRARTHAFFVSTWL